MYLANLTLRLLSGAGSLDADFRAETRDFFLAEQRPDGGFAGRGGESDIYYTAFALRGLGLLGELAEKEVAAKCAKFIGEKIDEELSGIDSISLLFSALLLEMNLEVDIFAENGFDRTKWALERIESLRRPDGGLASTVTAAYSSTYHTFLGTASLELMGLLDTEKNPDLAAWVMRRQRADGGFVELEKLHRSGTNPTVAAIAILNLTNGFPPESKGPMRAFLLSMWSPEGGFRANGMIPSPDLLSTFSSLVALCDLEAEESIPVPEVRKFLDVMHSPKGGFRGGTWDNEPDIEYTFYGLAIEAILKCEG